MFGVSEINVSDDMILIGVLKSNAAGMAKTLQHLEKANVIVDMICQSVSTGGDLQYSFTASNSYLQVVLAALHDEAHSKQEQPMVSGGYAKICLFGKEMVHEVGVATRALVALIEANIDISLITTSDYDISLLIRQEDVDVAMEKLNQCFSLA